MKNELWEEALSIKKQIDRIEYELIAYGNPLSELEQRLINTDFVEVFNVRIDSKKLLEILPNVHHMEEELNRLNQEFEKL